MLRRYGGGEFMGSYHTKNIIVCTCYRSRRYQDNAIKACWIVSTVSVAPILGIGKTFAKPIVRASSLRVTETWYLNYDAHKSR